MKLNFLGSGACFYPSLGNTSAYFIIDNKLVLLDCGESVYERLLDKVDIDSLDMIYVVLTHLHADHVGSLGSLLSYGGCILKKKTYVIYPEESVCDLLTLMGIAKDFYIYEKEIGDLIPGLQMTYHEVRHAKDMKCFGYEISYQGDTVYYSGDAANIPTAVLDKFLNKEINFIYQDTSTKDKESKSHMYIGTLEEKIPIDRRKQVFCMHLDGAHQELMKSKGFSIIE